MSLTSTTLGMHVLDSSWDSTSPAHFGVSETKLIQLASQGGSGVIRVPLDLSEVTSSGYPQWQLDSIYSVLSTASNLGIKVIFEPGQTPVDLSADGTTEGTPGTLAQVTELAQRFATLVEQVYTSYPQYADTIEAWEVGNEPNLDYAYYGDSTYYDDAGDPDAPRFWAVDAEQGANYAQYLALTASAISNVEQSLNQDIKVIAAGVAHNDEAYLEAMFSQLQSMNAEIDGFTIHPYTFYSYDFTDPASGRPSEWVADPDASESDAWDYYHSFQGALNSIETVMEKYGYGDAEVHITEFGVPSFQGYRGAGEDGRIDQAKWYVEAFGVIDAWANENLKSLIAHRVLDSAYDWQNDQYNAFDDSDLTPDGTSINDSENAFGLYERLSSGAIVAKPALQILQAIAGNYNYSSIGNGILIDGTSSTIDLSSYGRIASEYTDGYLVMSREGDDQVTGSAYSDSIFAGDGDDTVNGWRRR